MQKKHFGDSYDIVKQSLLHWLDDFGVWSVHPMFTEPVSDDLVNAYQALLRAKVIVKERVPRGTSWRERPDYFSRASSCGNLLLDPDTGLRLEERHSPSHLLASELVCLAKKRRASLTIVFDQSVGNGKQDQRESKMVQKLDHLAEHCVHAFAYVSHACFIIAGLDGSLVNRARRRIIQKSGLPECRFLPKDPASR